MIIAVIGIAVGLCVCLALCAVGFVLFREMARRLRQLEKGERRLALCEDRVRPLWRAHNDELVRRIFSPRARNVRR